MAEIKKKFQTWSLLGIALIAVFLLIRWEELTEGGVVVLRLLGDGFCASGVLICVVQTLRLLYHQGALRGGGYVLYLLRHLFENHGTKLETYFDYEDKKEQERKPLLPGYVIAGLWILNGIALNLIS